MQVLRTVVGGLAVANLSGSVILAEQPAQNVDFVNHGVFNCHGVVPVIRNRRVAVCAVQQQGFAVLAAVNRCLQLLVAFVIAAHEANLNQLLAGLHLRLNDALARIGLGSERLLAEHILACCDGSQNIFLVIRISGGAHDCIDLGIVDHIDRVLKALDAVLLGNRQAECASRICTSNNFAALQGVVNALDMGTADAAGAYKTNSQSFHGIFSFWLLVLLPAGLPRRGKSDMH